MDKTTILSIKPIFIPKIVAVQTAGVGIIGAILATGLSTILILIISMLFGFVKFIDIGTVSMAIFLVSMIGVPAFLYELKCSTHAGTEFEFYDDYIDFSYYTKPFMNRKRGRLYYKDITDMVQYSNFYQNFSGLKTIQLHAPSTALYEKGQNFIGIQIEDIKIGKGIGKKIQALLDKSHAPTNSIDNEE